MQLALAGLERMRTARVNREHQRCKQAHVLASTLLRGKRHTAVHFLGPAAHHVLSLQLIRLWNGRLIPGLRDKPLT